MSRVVFTVNPHFLKNGALIARVDGIDYYATAAFAIITEANEYSRKFGISHKLPPTKPVKPDPNER